MTEEDTALLYDLIHGKPNSSFGPFLKKICQRAGVNQRLLGDMASAEYTTMMADGLVGEGGSSMTQQAISLVCLGKQRVSYVQMLIWIKVLDRHYNNERVKEYFKSKNLEMPVFTQELKDTLWVLSGYQSPDVVRKAAIAASQFDHVPKNLPKILPKELHTHRTSDTSDDLQIVRQSPKPADKHTDALDYRRVKELQE